MQTSLGPSSAHEAGGHALSWPGAQLTYWPPKAGPLLRRGLPVRHAYLLQRGAGYVTCRATPSMDIMLSVLRPGDWIGPEQILAGETPLLETRLLVTSELLRVERQQWLDSANARPGFALSVLAQAVRRQREITDRLTACLIEPIEDRLPRMLADLCEPLGLQSSSAPVQLPLTQEHLARMAGCTRATLHRGLIALARIGLLRLHRGIVEVPDPALLGRYADGFRPPALQPLAVLA